MQFIDGEVRLEINDNGADSILEPVAGTMSFDKGRCRFKINGANKYVAFRVNGRTFLILGDPENGNFGDLKILDESIQIIQREEGGFPFSSRIGFVLTEQKIPDIEVLEIEWKGVLNLTLKNINNPEA